MPLQFFHTEDLCRMIEALLDLRPAKKIINVGNAAVTIKEWVEVCYSAVGKTPDFINVLNGTEQRIFFPFFDYEYELDISTQNEIMPNLLTLKEGVRRAYEWYKSNKSAVRTKNYLKFIECNFH